MLKHKIQLAWYVFLFFMIMASLLCSGWLPVLLVFDPYQIFSWVNEIKSQVFYISTLFMIPALLLGIAVVSFYDRVRNNKPDSKDLKELAVFALFTIILAFVGGIITSDSLPQGILKGSRILVIFGTAGTLFAGICLLALLIGEAAFRLGFYRKRKINH